MEKAVFLDLGDATADNLYPALFQCFTIILCGYITGRLNVVSSTESKGIATFVGTFALPSLIFLSLARLDFSTVNWSFLLAILLAKGLIFIGVIIVTVVITKPINLGRAGIFAIFCTQSNDFALGYPIIKAIYEKTHPDYALYLYLMAPISLAILNPVAFVLMEINKQREATTPTIMVEGQRKNDLCKLKLVRQIAKGIVLNPISIMTVLGIIGNIICNHNLTVYIAGLLDVFGQSFSATALFLLGLRMVGQIHRLKGPALVLPSVLIMVKLIVLPVVMREFVSGLNAGSNESETLSLSTYAFLYGTIPTAPAVFVFSNLYQLEIDLMASSMVICTFLSAPMMFISAKVISINQDYAKQLKRFGYDLSIVAFIATLWVLIVFIVTKKYKRMPHRLTMCLVVSQLVLAASVIWGGPLTDYNPTWDSVLQQVLRTFSMYSCLLWTSMLAVGLIILQSRGACFVSMVSPVLAFVAWGAPAMMAAVLLFTRAPNQDINNNAANAIRLCLLIFSIIVTSSCTIIYVRVGRRTSATERSSDELSGLIDNAESTSHTQSVSNNVCYGTITTTPSPSRSVNGCCSNDPNCDNGVVNSCSNDIEDIIRNENECPSPSRCAGAGAGVGASGECVYSAELLRDAARFGLLPHEAARAHSAQALRHTVLIILYTLTMFIGITYATWTMMKKDKSGVFIEIEFLDIAANYGQGLIMFVLFGLDLEETFIPLIRYLKRKWYGADTVVLPKVDDLSFETKHVCEQFITHHLERCKEAIAKDIRCGMRTYRGAFRGACLSRWLVEVGLARDRRDAATYARHLLDGRLIAHVNNTHHFTDSPLLYTFL